MQSAYSQGFIKVTQRDASRQMLWKALHERLVTGTRGGTEIDQAWGVIKDLYEQRLITIRQHDETRKALGKTPKSDGE
jgi:hypothetical protein